MLALTFSLFASLGPAAPPAPCAFGPREAELAALLTTDAGQRRPTLTCSPELVAFARARAADLVARRYVGHVDPDNRGPNDALRATGYPLPAAYLKGRGNNVEALATGIARPVEVWAALLDSADHRPHLLGEVPFYAEQDEFGLAYLRDDATQEVDHWIIVIARRARPDDARLLCSPPPGGCESAPVGPKLRL